MKVTDKLPSGLNIQANRVAVAGISSGGFMTTQLQLAYPETFPLAAVLAGGPYDCLKVAGAMAGCLSPSALTDQQLTSAVNRAVQNAKDHSLGDLNLLNHGSIYVLYGTADQVVGTKIAGAVTTFYKKLQATLPTQLAGLQISEDGTHRFGHTFPTYLPPLPDDDCIKSVSPYLGHCGFDGAKNILEHLYPDIKTGDQPDGAAGAITKLRSANSLPPSAAYAGKFVYVYTPKACMNGQPCGLVLALHGCNQNETAIGLKFVRDVGFNRWADDYRVIVVYPQTRTVDQNYGGCWDWWGYTGTQFDTRAAPQMAWLNRLVNRVANLSGH
ncbi:PHB depolymerase family esterase [Trinickia acidisoli]|uniref:PHB depolymerase family esterase n=1 Tax=Trinickia acidisoli TaxID=2767482 RepID=UPI002852EF75|nr:PHB depolymerase family esterase [Trinickia acidisoli]